jgi:hypothetical protein
MRPEDRMVCVFVEREVEIADHFARMLARLAQSITILILVKLLGLPLPGRPEHSLATPRQGPHQEPLSTDQILPQ